VEVITLSPIDPREFVAAVQPLLEARDTQGLHDLLCDRWTREQIKGVLACDDLDARKVACLAMALMGGKCCLAGLELQLKDPDPVVNQMAEHALWSIWFRCGSPEANHELCIGTRALNSKDTSAAIDHFTNATLIDPSFAEAYNQRGIAKYLAERYEECIDDCQAAVERMPCHFGAWAGIGHCHAHLGRLAEAVKCYERALSINPHLECLQEAISELKRQIEES
jgi:tetratricopeptide (TPR) repeat protein